MGCVFAWAGGSIPSSSIWAQVIADGSDGSMCVMCDGTRPSVGEASSGEPTVLSKL